MSGEKSTGKEAFAGDKKHGTWLLARWESRFRDWMVPKVPARIETWHLTLTTLLWCALILIFSFLAQYDMRWMHGVSVWIALQWFTDLLDGAVGRTRNTGLIKWGYYMDHLLDYFFLCAILIGYSFLLPEHYNYMLFFILALFCGFMVNSFLEFAATNSFRISYLGIGPTEIRLMFILINTLLGVFGKTYMAKALPLVLSGAAFGLFVTVFNTQRRLWFIDMRKKVASEHEANPK